MPKRKREDSCEKLFKKIKKLEKKLRRRRRSLSSNSSDSLDLQEQEHVAYNEVNDSAENNITELLDGENAPMQDCYVEVAANRTTPVAATEVLHGGNAPEQDICVTLDTDMAAQRAAPAATTSATVTVQEQATAASHLTNTDCEEVVPAVVIPDSVILDILGEDPTVPNTYGTEIHKDLAVRLEHVATHGLSKELRKELIEKYLLPSNCKLINAPALNAEIKAAISDVNVKRDKSIEIRQKQMATAISSLSQVINKLISNKNTDPELTKTLMDSERILCDLQYNDSVIRRNFILSSLKKEMKDQLQNTKPDNLLFGENLSETIKTAKAINKSGADLKTTLPKPQANNKKPQAATATSRNLNWKGPYVNRKQTTQPKTKGPPPNNRPSNSSRHSRQQPTRSRR